MSSVAEARAFARTKTHGQLEVGDRQQEIAVAFSPEGHVLLEAPEPLPSGRARLELSDPSGALLRFVGNVSGLASGDDERLRAIHEKSGAHRGRIEPQSIEWAAVAGARASLDPSDWLLRTPEWRDREAGINEHMNDDHIDAMERMCLAFRDLEAREPRLVAVDPEGLVIRTLDGLVHIEFDEPAYTHDDVHHATVRLARLARQRLDEAG